MCSASFMLRPVACTGICSRAYQLSPLKYAIATRCQQRVERVDYGSPFRGDLDLHAQAVAEVLGRVKPHSGMVDVNFVAHGYGALVLRRAFSYVDYDDVPGRVVLLAPFNRGCAAWTCWRAHACQRYAHFPVRCVVHPLGPSCALVRSVAAWPGVRRLPLWRRGALAELAKHASWHFARVGAMPKRHEVLVLAGTRGWNPWVPDLVSDGPHAIDREHDGRVSLMETVPPFPHALRTVPAPHSLLMYHPCTLSMVVAFLAGRALPNEE